MGPSLKNSRYLRALLSMLLVFITATSRAAEPPPLVIGITPFISTVALYKRFSPLSHYLSQQLGREVIIETVKNPELFSQEIGRHRYDLIFATPVMTLTALDGGHYNIGVASERKILPLLLVKGQSFIEHPKQLANKKVALPPRVSAINIMAKKWFISKGLKPEELPEFIHYNSHNAAYQAALSGDVDATFVASFAVKQMRKKLPLLRIIDNADYLPGSSILYAHSVDHALQRELTRLLVQMKYSQQGRDVLNQISQPPFREAIGSEYEVIRPYLASELGM
ncbi:MAG: phosphate/phosphite/phosphonate ABC transporter substrate-binding protein [Gammaproteobacteria bacterium]|nr:phosphate/phosphite/phosphonate ABC transporter substrate-binding protein [Gammaproteobacteria bacterium]